MRNKFLLIFILLSACYAQAQNISVAYPNAAWGAGQYLGMVRYIHPSHVPGTKDPVIIWLHGNGGASDYNSGSTTAAKGRADYLRTTEMGLIKDLESGTDISSRKANNGANPLERFVVLAPCQDISQDFYITGIGPNYVQYTLQYIRDSLTAYVDTNRIYIIGYSGGGSGSKGYIIKGPAEAYKVAASVHIAGVPVDPPSGGSYCNIVTQQQATWWFHATDDGTVGVVASSSSVSSINVTCGATGAYKALFYNPSTGGHTGIVPLAINPSNRYSDASNVTAPTSSMNIYEWMLQYKRDFSGTNNPPVANAGADQAINLPTTSTTLDASGSLDIDNGIATYQWIKLSGPSGGTITTPGPSSGAITTTITSLQAGVYQYRLVVTDNGGATDDDTVGILVTSALPSTHKVAISSTDIWNLTAKKNPEYWFNGNLTDKIENEFNIGNAYAQPMKVALVLGDSCWNHMKVRFKDSFTVYNYQVQFFDSTKALLGTYNHTSGSGWNDLAGRPDTISKPVRFIWITLDNVQSGVSEIELYGDAVAKCSDIAPKNPTASTFTDPGYWFQGGSAIGGKDTTYMTLASGLPFYGSMRSPANIWVFTHDETAPFNRQPIEVDKFGDFDKSTLRFHKRMQTPVMFYQNGASVSSNQKPGLTSSSGYSALSQLNNYKDIPKGSDSTNRINWANNTGRVFKALTWLWGNNPGATLSPDYNVYGTSSPNLSPGQGKIRTMEIGNEDDKTWQGVEGYHSPEVLLAKLSAAYDSIKSVDPTMRVHLGALLSADTLKWRAMYFLRFWNTGIKGLPADGLNFNQYISTAYGGQPQGGTEDAISPEQFQIREKIIKYRAAADRYCNNCELNWTEIGYAVGASDYNVNAVSGLADSIVQAGMILRTYERSATVPNGLNVVYNYFHTSDGSGSFASMFMVTEIFDQTTFAYLYSKRRPQWWFCATRMNTLYGYNGWNTLLVDGDSTGTNVYRYSHKTNANKKVFTVYRGTYNGSTVSNYTLTIGAGATSAKLITCAYGDEDGVQALLTISGNSVTIPTVNEVPQWVEVTYGTTPKTKFRIRAGTKWNLKSTP